MKKSWRARSLTGWRVRKQHTHCQNSRWPSTPHLKRACASFAASSTIWQLSLALPLVAMCRLLQPNVRKGLRTAMDWRRTEGMKMRHLPGAHRQASNSSVLCLTCMHICVHWKGKSEWAETWAQLSQFKLGPHWLQRQQPRSEEPSVLEQHIPQESLQSTTRSTYCRSLELSITGQRVTNT